jgi:uncharacterized protein (DUF58 family)
MYFGSFLLLLFLVSLLFPLVSVFLTASAARSFRFRQSWNHDQPVKGEQLECVLTLTNDSIFPLYRVEARFHASTPLTASGVSANGTPASAGTIFRFFLKPRQKIRKPVRVGFPFRGVYTFGVDSITVSDFLQVIRFSLPANPTVFTVYPPIHRMEVFPAEEVAGEGVPSHRFREVLPDFTLFSHLRDYRPGESLKHIAWKKFAGRGVPLIREYDSVLDNSVRIYLDLRLPQPVSGLSPAEKLTLEDTSVEMLVALVRGFLLRGIPTYMTAAGSEPIRFFGRRPEQFLDLYSATLAMTFHDTISPARLQQAEALDRREGGTTIIISHLPDAETQAAADQAAALNQNVYLIVNGSALGSDRRPGSAAGPSFPPLRGRRVVYVDRPEQIATIFAR